MPKTAAQLDAEIEEALNEGERKRERERARLTDAISSMSPHNQEVTLRVQEMAALGEMLKDAGLRIEHLGSGSSGKIAVSGKPTYQVRDVLKKYGFRFDGQGKRWIKPKDYSKTDIDYLSFYSDLVKHL